MNKAVLSFLLVFFAAASARTQTPAAPVSDQLPADYIQTHNLQRISGRAVTDGGVLGRQSSANTLGVDTVVNWSSYFYESAAGNPDGIAPGYFQFAFPYTMVGKAPFGNNSGIGNENNGGTTNIDAPVIAVSLDLRNFDGSPRFVNGQRLISDATQYIAPVLASPVFSNSSYDSSNKPTQFTDAIQRAEFFNSSSPGWHTMLAPRVATPRTMTLIRGTYRFALNLDGSCCYFVLIDAGTFVNELFPTVPTDTTTVIGAAENAKDITTADISSFIFPNAFLFVGGNPANCCIGGFHTYDLEPGDALNGFRERRYIVNYSSYLQEGIFGPGTGDVTGLSHELSETFNDPFGSNAVPWWLSPNGNCQNNLETGDVIEGLPNQTFLTNLNGATWHPQNEALLQWFAGVENSSAIHHAYSYPDITVLSSTNLPQNPGCAP